MCPWSWALEPALRKLIYQFGDGLGVTYVLGGMMRELDDPSTHIRAALDASERSGMPVDPRLWLEAAPASSHPACIAVKAAAEQGEPGPYLRRLREGFMCRRHKLDTGESLVAEARATDGLDAQRFTIDLSSHAMLEAFAADLELVTAENVKLPTFEFGDGHRLHGFVDYDSLRAAALAGGAELIAPTAPTVEEALRRFGRMATAEVAAVCELPGPRAPAELWRLASEWRVKPERVLGGELWTLV
jgi:predicted DsbA family dithiol-disulfide isomerase